MGVLIKIKENYGNLTKSEKKIGDYVMENLEIINNLSVQELGDITSTSPASIIRFSKKIGYDSLTELKFDLILEQENQRELKKDYIIEQGDNIENLFEKLLYKNMMAMKDTIALQNQFKINRLIKKLKKAENIYLFAVGASGLVAMDFQYKMIRVNKKINYNLDSNLQLMSVRGITNRDIAIGISYTGETNEVNLAIEQAKLNGAITVGIVTAGKNTLNELVDININIPKIEKKIRVGAISSRVAQLMITDALFLGIIRDELDEVDKNLIETRELIGKLKGK